MLDGGLARCPSAQYREIHSCWVTNTRLMGVLVVCVRWKNVSVEENDLFHFFYFDYEEYGLDRFESFAGEDRTELAELESDLIGGLGGRKVALRMREAVSLIQGFVRHNLQNHIALPGEAEEYRFYQYMEGSLTAEEEEILWRKTCVQLESENGLANYFLMRCFGRDFDGAALLAEEGVELDLFPEFPAGTFYRNRVILSVTRNGCQCRSIVEAGGTHFLVVTELDFRNLRISGYRRVSLMALSPEEVYMNLSHDEFVTVYQFDGGPADFGRESIAPARNAVISEEHGGRTFMLYQPDNSHVEKSSYQLQDDLLGVIHVGNGQLLASAQTLRNIHKLEIALHTSEIFWRMHHVGSFQFLEPVLMRFLDSRFEDFMEFLEAIKIE